MARNLIIIGIVFMGLGVLWPWLKHIPLGRLPGDIIIQKQNFRLYFPITSSIVVSLLLTFLFWFFGGRK